jgi:hypothetical protein
LGIRITPGLVLVAMGVAPCVYSCWFPSKAASPPAPAAEVAQPESSAQRAGDPPSPSDDDARRSRFADWLRERLPTGGRVEDSPGRPLEVIHTAAAGDTAVTIAKAYLDLTDVYRARDLGATIAKDSPAVRAGTEVRIPHLLSEPIRDPGEARLSWPADRALKGIYITGGTAGIAWPETLERIQTHGLNAVVLDAKPYDGAVTYPSHVKLAMESDVGRVTPIPDFSRAIRFAHERGIRVIARVTCFHDPWLAAHAPRTSIRSTAGEPAGIGWVDPANAEVQDYLVDLVKEVIDLGADEVQLDYVRFPVEGLVDAAMLAADGHRSRAIAAFVARVHEAAEAHHVPLSLDVFGIAASAPRSDIEKLGQNLLLLGPETEAISPMVYPSHYPVGSLGFDQPGDHPELVGFGTKAAVTKLEAAPEGTGRHETIGRTPEGTGRHETIIRPWLQASSFRVTNFGPQYIQDEIASAEANGAVGWLMWDAANSYWAVWRALPMTRTETPTRHE